MVEARSVSTVGRPLKRSYVATGGTGHGALARPSDAAVPVGRATEGLLVKKVTKRKIYPIYFLLAIPYIALLCVPLFNRASPALMGIPFFYWYQILWALLVGLTLAPIYLFEENRRK
jgi:hypothetical protein